MNLSPVAKRYLMTLERVEAVPTRIVEDELRRSSTGPLAVWLDFHENFAGYVQPLGRESATWGLMHRDPEWLEPLSLDLEPEKDGSALYVACADVHPSYDYRLDDKGAFLSPPAESFGVFVERSATLWDFGARGPVAPMTADELQGEAFLRRLSESNPEPSLSDVNANYYALDGCFVVWAAGDARPRRGWKRV